MSRASFFKPFRRFTYITAHSLTLPSLHLSHTSFFNPSVASPTSQLILQLFRRFNYVTAHSLTLPSLHLRHSSFYNPFCRLPTSPEEPPMHLFKFGHKITDFKNCNTNFKITLPVFVISCYINDSLKRTFQTRHT